MKSNESENRPSSEKISARPEAIAAAAALTLILACILTAIIWNLVGLPAWLGIPLFIIVALVHPIVGRVVATMALQLADGIDDVYDLEGSDRWGDWTKGTQILFAAAWPIAGPIYCAIAGVGLMYGRMYKDMFD